MDEKHVVFGFVADGMEVVRAIERVGTPTGKPRVAVTITECGMYYGVKHAPSGKLVNVEAEDTWEMQRERALKAQAEAEAQAAEARKARLEARLAARGKRHSNKERRKAGLGEIIAWNEITKGPGQPPRLLPDKDHLSCVDGTHHHHASTN